MLAGFRVEDKDTADVEAVDGRQWRTGVESEMRLPLDEGQALVSVMDAEVVDDEQRASSGYFIVS